LPEYLIPNKSIEKESYMNTVGSFIRKNGMWELHTIGTEEPILSALKRMKKYNVGALPVVGKDNKLLGIISERDFARACSRSKSCSLLSIYYSWKLLLRFYYRNAE
jgi:predicted transcriptional regulator